MTDKTKATPTLITVAMLDVKINALTQASKITKKQLGELSRDLLTYIHVQNSTDVDAINRTINALTPVNKTMASMFFKRFIPWTMSEDNFTKKQGAKQCAKCLVRTTEFLADANNNIWSWAAESVELNELKAATTKPKAYADKIAKLVIKALGDENEDDRISADDVMKALLSTPISLNDLVKAVSDREKSAADKPASDETK